MNTTSLALPDADAGGLRGAGLPTAGTASARNALAAREPACRLPEAVA